MKFKQNYWYLLRASGLIGILAAIGMGAADCYVTGQSALTDRLTLMLWPTCVITQSIQSGTEYGLYACSVAANALLYMVLCSFVLLGTRKHRAFLLVPVLSIALIWWGMFTTYGSLLVASSSDVPLY